MDDFVEDILAKYVEICDADDVEYEPVHNIVPCIKQDEKGEPKFENVWLMEIKNNAEDFMDDRDKSPLPSCEMLVRGEPSCKNNVINTCKVENTLRSSDSIQCSDSEWDNVNNLEGLILESVRSEFTLKEESDESKCLLVNVNDVKEELIIKEETSSNDLLLKTDEMKPSLKSEESEYLLSENIKIEHTFKEENLPLSTYMTVQDDERVSSQWECGVTITRLKEDDFCGTVNEIPCKRENSEDGSSRLPTSDGCERRVKNDLSKTHSTFKQMCDNINVINVNRRVSKYECKICRKLFDKRKLVNRHLKIHLGIYKCDVCHKCFVKHKSLIYHKCIQYANMYLYNCDVCGRHFTQKVYLENHLLNHRYKCDQCRNIFLSKQEITKHLPEHNVHICQICSKHFTGKENLYKHFETHKSGEWYMCVICKKYFSNRYTLSTHMKSHCNIKNYKCDLCHKHYKNKTYIYEHLKNVHESDKTYKCTICQKYFKKYCLINHIKSHNSINKYKCDICQKLFCQKRNVSKHLQVAHKVI